MDAQYWGQLGTGPTGYFQAHINDGSTGVVFAGAGTWKKVTGATFGINEGFVAASDEYECQVPGVYLVTWSITYQAASTPGSDLIEGGIAKNSTILGYGRCSRTSNAGLGWLHISSTAMVSLNYGGTIEVQMRNVTDTDGVTIKHLELTVSRVR